MTALEQTLATLHSIQDSLRTVESQLQAANKDLENTEEQKSELQSKIANLEQELSETKNKLNQAEQKLQEFEDQMSSLRKLYEEASQQAEQKIDAVELLALYSTLFEHVFHGDTHAKILFLLHGAEREWSITDIKQTLGIEGAHLLRCVHDLRNSGVIEHNEDQGTVKLLQRVF